MSYLKNLYGLAGQTAIVAGGAGVIGQVMARALLAAGADVHIWSRSQASIDQALENLNADLEGAGQLTGRQVDTGDEKQVHRALVAACRPSRPPGILVNAVGGNLGKGPFVETDINQFAKDFGHVLQPNPAQQDL